MQDCVTLPLKMTSQWLNFGVKDISTLQKGACPNGYDRKVHTELE
jgi:hypothetical protein